MLTGSRLRQKLEPTAGQLRAVGNLLRLSILYTLAREPMEFGRMVHRLKIRPSLLAHHLKQLTLVGWLTKIKVGKLVTYYIEEDAIKKMSTFLRGLLITAEES